MLEALGVRDEDEAVYRELLSRTQARVDELAEVVDGDARRVEAALTRLEELGLVSRLPGQPLRVRAARPDVAVDVWDVCNPSAVGSEWGP